MKTMMVKVKVMKMTIKTVHPMKKLILHNNQLKKSNQMLQKSQINHPIKKLNNKQRTTILEMAVMKRRIKLISLKNLLLPSNRSKHNNNSSNHNQFNSTLKLKAAKKQMEVLLPQMDKLKTLGVTRMDKDYSHNKLHNQQEMVIFLTQMVNRQLIYLLTPLSYLIWQITIMPVISPYNLSLLS